MRIIGGRYRGKKLQAPTGMTTRPTADRARESLFNIIDSYFRKNGIQWADVSVLDGFAGTGAVGVEALSRGAKRAVLVDCHPAAVRAIALNQVEGVEIIQRDIRALGATKQPCTLVFLDPPYQQGLIKPAIAHLSQTGWIGMQTLVVVEAEKSETVSLPDFEVLDNRCYGKAQFIFLRRKT